MSTAWGQQSGWFEALHLSATGSASWVNNLSRTSYEPTRHDGATYEFSLSGSRPRQLAPSVLFVASGELSTLTVPDYDLSDQFKTSGRLSLQKKFGLGPLATVLQVYAGAAYKSARLEADRGWTTDAGVQLAKRVLPSVRVAAGANWLEHAAKSSTFDLRQHSYSAEASWDIDEHWTLAGSASRLHGDIVANAAWSVWERAITGGFGPAVLNYYTARPWSVTNFYGPGWVSYNVEADVNLWTLALAYAFSDRTSVELRKSTAYVINQLGIRYPSDAWGLSLTHRF